MFFLICFDDVGKHVVLFGLDCWDYLCVTLDDVRTLDGGNRALLDDLGRILIWVAPEENGHGHSPGRHLSFLAIRWGSLSIKFEPQLAYQTNTIISLHGLYQNSWYSQALFCLNSSSIGIVRIYVFVGKHITNIWVNMFFSWVSIGRHPNETANLKWYGHLWKWEIPLKPGGSVLKCSDFLDDLGVAPL